MLSKEQKQTAMLNRPTSDQAYEKILQNEEFENYDTSKVKHIAISKFEYSIHFNGLQYKVVKAWMRIQKGFWGEPFELFDSNDKSMGHFFSLKNAKGYIMQEHDAN